MGALPIPGTSWVRILPGYRCMRTPGVPVFAPKKNFPVWVGSDRVRYGLGTGGTKTKPNGVVSTRSLLLSLLSQAEPLDSLSHFLTLPATGDGRCSDCGLAAMKAAPIII
jgi:hypothetical protein